MSEKKSESEENLVVNQTRKFGWCVTEQHEGCRIRFGFYNTDYRCSCSCHDKKDLPPLVRGQNQYPIDPNFDPHGNQRQRKSRRKA